jgi:FtsH-binding integral membrane protein
MMQLSHRRILHPDYLLVGIKVLHTAVWAVMAGSILALPAAAFTRRFGWALMLTALVMCECAVLAANRGRCPMTDWAARFTSERAANFDIYLPEWLARNNKAIFGTLFVVNELIVLWRWLVRP